MFSRSILLICVLLVTISTKISNGQKYCGIALDTGHDLHGYRQPKTDKVINSMKRDGANYVQISAYGKQNGKDPRKYKQETDDNSLRLIIRKVKQRKLKVFLKAVIEPRNKKGAKIWRGFIPGSKGWFDNVHTPFILGIAKLAEEEGVDILSIGSEYVGTLWNVGAWLETIRAVREVFSGRLTYIANHDSYYYVNFFHKLDFISISAYYRLRHTMRGPYPDLKGTKALYNHEATKLLAWRKRMNLGHKRVLIAEFGMMSKGNGVGYYMPWDWTVKAPLSFSDQVKFYEAFFSTFVAKKWSLGVMIWYYELEISGGKSGHSKSGYTPQNKDAVKVLRKYFHKLC